MASGWTNSGIDWTSEATMRESRTEDIVREIYLAIHERDFWVQRWTQRYTTNYGTSFPNIEYTSRTRLENQMRFIYNTLRAWLTLDLTPSIAGLFVPNQAVWIDENQITQGQSLTDTVNLGLAHWDMSQNGNLETELSVDLDFLRNTGNYRIRLDELFTVYKILNFLTKCRAYQIESDQNGTGFSNDLLNLNISSVGCGAYIYQHSSGRFADPTTTKAYNDWSSSTRTTFVGAVVLAGYNQRTTSSPGYILSSTEAYFQFESMVGFDGGSYEADDFTFNMLFNEKFAASSNPGLNLSNGINAMGDIQESDGAKAFPFPNTIMQTFPPTPSSGSQTWANTGDLLPFVDMNKEGFLKYYTEP